MSFEINVKLEVAVKALPKALQDLDKLLLDYPHSIEIIGASDLHDCTRLTIPEEKLMQEKAGILPIKLSPLPVSTFKTALLETKRAEITVHYGNGSVKHKPWVVREFNESSGVLNNLRSRAEFRQGAWLKAGIVLVEVAVVEA